MSLVLVLVLALPGCDRDSGKTPDELLVEDTTLAMDLARVNDALNDGEPDTAIGLTDDVPVPEATSDASEARNARDADLRAEAPQRAEAPTRAEVATRPVPAAPRARPAPPAPAPRTLPTPTPVPPAAPVRLGASAAECQSPAAADQRSCLLSLLAQYDVGLNAAYRGVIERMRRDAGIAAGAPDPASVRELRAEQRSWLVYRDQECRRRTQSREGELWAPVRARCLGQLSDVRAAVLRAM
ncbi:MAG: DUF1311 domain-containing protein [Gemmatimonadaceae bacterium]|nr:DUF1311 domain-containing protein [Gemmatimonadaceae bacterium]